MASKFEDIAENTFWVCLVIMCILVVAAAGAGVYVIWKHAI